MFSHRSFSSSDASHMFTFRVEGREAAASPQGDYGGDVSPLPNINSGGNEAD